MLLKWHRQCILLASCLVHLKLVSSFGVSPSTTSRSNAKSSLGVSFSSHAADDFPESQHSNRRAEFSDLEPLPESTIRKSRVNEDKRNRRKFVKYGDDLWTLRRIMNNLSEKLLTAIRSGVREKEEQIRNQLREIERQDPELVYKMELQKLRNAQNKGKTVEAELHSKNAIGARSCLPHFNLEGLWVGKYGHHGYEMINITYHGDTLVASKVTGDKNVPRGEITFQVDLNPLPKKVVGLSKDSNPIPPMDEMDTALQPISLTEKAAKKWGTTQLPRYKGLGQVAETGFTNNQWMDGQLIIIGEEYFSFAWVPIEQQIFFGRPSPELALKMLRESSAAAAAVGAKVWEEPPSVDESVNVLKEYAFSCLEKTTETVEEEFNGDPFSCIWHGMESEECYFQ